MIKKNEGFKVLRERHTTGEMHFPLLVFTLSSLAEAALRSGSRSGGLKPARALALAPGRLGSHESGLFQNLPYVVRFVRSHTLKVPAAIFPAESAKPAPTS